MNPTEEEKLRNKKIIQNLARQALDVQDACNLSGVVHAWSRAMESIFPIGYTEQWGTDKINQHPINQLFASKVHDLCRMGLSDTDAFSKAYDECKRLAEENLE